MRLLFLNPTASMGGAERVLLDMLTMLRRARPTWTVGLIVGNDGTLVAEARAVGVETTVLPFPRVFARLGDTSLDGPVAWLRFLRRAAVATVSLVGYVRHLSAAIARFEPDILHSNGFKMHILSAVASRPAGTSLIWHFHDYLGSRRVTGRIIRFLKPRCQMVIAVSKNVAEDIRQVLGSQPPVTPLWNAVDLERFTPDGSVLDLDALAGLEPAPHGTVRIGLVATFARWKGHLVFLESLVPLVQRYPIRAYIVGGPLYETDGSQVSMAELKDAIARLELGSHVGLTGFVRDAAAALRSLDVVVHGSTSPEPFGLVIAEAMACGRAVVVSNSGGVAELVSHEVNALVYRSGDVQALTAATERLLIDPELRQRLSASARASADQQFAPATMESDLLACYGTLAQASARAAHHA